jgi:hypothetical protein
VTAALAIAAAEPKETRMKAWSKSCGVCQRTYGSAQWEALPVVESLEPAAVQAHLSVPAVWSVELRRCACGATLATRTRTSG